MSNEDARQFLKQIFSAYKKKRKKNAIDLQNLNLFKNIINTYLTCVDKRNIDIIIDDYKEKYIFTESRIEKNTSVEEQLGIGEMYDYIRDFDFSKDYFNIFTTSLILHSKLYSKCAYPEYGGKLRDTTVYLFDTNYEVADPLVAQKYFNSLIPISSQIFNSLNEETGGGYFTYINDCIKQTTELIKLQPFADGNKRTFRALLNLLLKRIKIPPINIEIEESKNYKEALLEAIIHNDYSKIINFYYYKICDAIITLDIEHVLETEDLKR